MPVFPWILVTAAAAPATEPAELYTQYCATCHGVTGLGDGPMAATLDPRPASFADPAFWTDERDDDRLVTAILKGGPAVGASPSMVAWRGAISKGEARDLVAWLRQTWAPTPELEPAPEPVATLPDAD